jgi:hypothetical protein
MSLSTYMPAPPTVQHGAGVVPSDVRARNISDLVDGVTTLLRTPEVVAAAEQADGVCDLNRFDGARKRSDSLRI